MKKKLMIFTLQCMCILMITACGKKENQTLSDNIAGMTNEIQGMDTIDAQIEAEKNSAQFLTNDETDETLSDNSSGSISGNDLMGDMDSDDTERKQAELEEYFEENSSNAALSISNLSGRDFKEVNITIASCGINDLDVTQGKKLKDGSKIKYTFADMQSFREADNIILTIKGVNKKGDVIDFGDIKIVDVSNMNVILTYDNDNYKMYIK